MYTLYTNILDFRCGAEIPVVNSLMLNTFHKSSYNYLTVEVTQFEYLKDQQG